MIVIFVFADLCVAIGIIIGFALSCSLRVKGKEPKGVNYGIPQQPSVPPMPERLSKLDEIEQMSKYVSMNKARENMGVPELPEQRGLETFTLNETPYKKYMRKKDIELRRMRIY